MQSPSGLILLDPMDLMPLVSSMTLVGKKMLQVKKSNILTDASDRNCYPTGKQPVHARTVKDTRKLDEVYYL